MNVKQSFEQLLPDRRRHIATVIADRGDGTAMVESPAGSRYVVALGGLSVAPGDRIIIRAGAAIANAPALPTFSVSV